MNADPYSITIRNAFQVLVRLLLCSNCMSNDRPNVAYIASLLELRNGDLYWKRKPDNRANRIRIGEPAGSLSPEGYWMVGLNYRLYHRSHLVWVLTYREWPPADRHIDHCDRNRANDHPSNLRLATRTQQNQNIGLRSDNKSGFKGITWDVRCKKWKATIHINKKSIHLGVYEFIKDAVDARRIAEPQHYDMKFYFHPD